jgi:site-specific recombinase XerD
MQTTGFSQASQRVASIHFGQVYCSKSLAVARAGIPKRIGWHTFRHTYATLLVANGENVKVVQELMRHASTRFTLEIYSQAQLIAKRAAQERLVDAILHEGVADSLPAIVGEAPEE